MQAKSRFRKSIPSFVLLTFLLMPFGGGATWQTRVGSMVQDFALSPAAMVNMEGTVTDGSGHPGMPLYARLDISGYPSSPVFTDPATGYYSLELPEGETFTFNVSAVSPGYNAETRQVTPAPGGTVEDFALSMDAALCSAPGYRWPEYVETFETADCYECDGAPLGWRNIDHQGGGKWSLGGPGGNLTGGTGRFEIMDSYDGAGCTDYWQDAELRTPLLDLSALSVVSLQFDTDFIWAGYEDWGSNPIADVHISNDGGASWINLWTRSGADYRGPAREIIDITTLAAGQPDVMVRFHYYNATCAGWWQLDNVSIGPPPVCEPIPGGWLVGNVYDQNTGDALNGARVASGAAAGSATTAATPDDPNLDDGFYRLFSTLTGEQPFTASIGGHYGADSEQPVVAADGAVRQDFNLPAGLLGADPASLTVTLGEDQTAERKLTLSNTGGLAVDFELVEANLPPLSYEPTGLFAEAGRHLDSKPQPDRDARGVQTYDPPAAEPLAAGEMIDSWPTGLVHPWGIGFNTDSNDMWVGDLLVDGGDDLDHRFLPDGTNTGDTIDTAPWVGAWGADMTYNPLTGMLWQVNVGGDNCIYELDPVHKVSTGNKICPAFPTTQRGLAFDPRSNTFYAGSWNDGVIYHFDASGTMLDSVSVGINISGLAFNPLTGSLFVMNNFYYFTVYVLDVYHNYNRVGRFNIAGLDDYEQAGLEIDCDGTLWAVNQITGDVIAATSGESGVCDWGIPWLFEDLDSGVLNAGAEETITLSFDSTGLAPGTYEAYLRFAEDTPYDPIFLPVTLIVDYDYKQLHLPLIHRNH